MTDVEIVHLVVSWTCGFFVLLMVGIAIPVMLSFLPDAVDVWLRRGDVRPAIVLVAVLVGLSALTGYEVTFTGSPGTPTTSLWLTLAVLLGVCVALATCCFTISRAFQRASDRRRTLREVTARPASRRTASTERSAPTAVQRLNARAAEYLVQDWMRFLGAEEAVVTPQRRDGGVDVRSRDFVAQVKHIRNEQIGVAAIRQLYGVAAAEQRRALFFSTSGYTRDALAFARENDVALFVVRHQQGRLVPHGALAQRYVAAGLRGVPQH